MFFFFNVLINHFPKIHRNALQKIAIDVCDVSLWGKSFGKGTAYSCRTNVFTQFYNFKAKNTKVFSCEICETFRNSSGCFWKHVTYYYAIKNYIGHKLAIFNAIPFTLLHLLLPRWWDMRLKHNVVWLWEEKVSRNVCRNKKKHWSCHFTLIRIDTILSKTIYNNFQNLLFRKLPAQSGNQTDIFWKFYSSADILWSPRTVSMRTKEVLILL